MKKTGCEAGYHERLEGGAIRCSLCRHGCLLRPGKTGLCGVRENREGVLRSLVYGLVAAEAADPVEKKPLYHFLPGSRTWSIATMGCNFRCRHCQNHTLSQVAPGGRIFGATRSPAGVVNQAKQAACASISYTYSEPTVFLEFAEDCGRLAREAGLANILVSNGYMSPAAAENAASWLDAANIDIKAFSEDFYRDICGARLAPVLETVRRLVHLGIWVEATTLLIPGLNDRDAELEGLAAFLASLSQDIPWHLSAFHPAYKLLDAPPTPPETLLRAREIGRAAGLKHVYLGNVMLPGGGDTLCPGCGQAVIRREGFRASVAGGSFAGRCPRCGETVAGQWRIPAATNSVGTGYF